MPKAFTRAVSPRLSECELTHLQRVPIDAAEADAQHSAYERALEAAGYEVVPLARPSRSSRWRVRRRYGAPARRPCGHSSPRRCVSGSGNRLDRCWPGGPFRIASSDRGPRRRRRRAPHREAALRRPFEPHRRHRHRKPSSDRRPLGFEVVQAKLDGCLHLKTGATLAGLDESGNPVLLYAAEASIRRNSATSIPCPSIPMSPPLRIACASAAA